MPSRFLLLAAGLMMLLPTTGCDTSAPKAGPQAAKPAPTPEERFDNLVKSLRRQINDSNLVDSAALSGVNAEPGTPVTDASTTIQHEILPPANDGDPYRATVTLTLKSTVTVVLPQKSEEAKEAEEEAENKLGDEIEGVPPLDSLVVPSADSTLKSGGSPIKSMGDEESSTYEFEFRDGRWELLTELDREKEPFNALAIEYALKRQ